MEVESKVSVADFSHNMFWVLCYVMCVENDYCVTESALYFTTDRSVVVVVVVVIACNDGINTVWRQSVVKCNCYGCLQLRIKLFI